MSSQDQINSEIQDQNSRSVKNSFRYLTRKFLMIVVTIFIGVFVTVMITNQPSKRGLGPPVSPFETSLEAQIFLVVRSAINNGSIQRGPLGDPDPNQIQELTDKLRNDMGLNLQYLPQTFGWTIRALTFNWGDVGKRQGGWGASDPSASAMDIIFHYLPNTLLLVTTTYLLVFLIGMPLSLYLARNYGKWADRLFSILSPISSVPSWVFGILLIAIFAFQLRWFPFGGMFELSKPENEFMHILDVAKHMVLPVSAFVLSLLFQIVYAWRTFFVIYSEEDYVQLAQAKGLSANILNKKYILRPALPYIITSFATSLISFWQLSMALEVVFRWPGLGWLYIKEALPNFWGESMEPGELIIAVGIVVIFAYLLGLVVFLLDLVYVVIDPRIRLLPDQNKMKVRSHVKSFEKDWKRRFQTWLSGRINNTGSKPMIPPRNQEFRHPWCLEI